MLNQTVMPASRQQFLLGLQRHLGIDRIPGPSDHMPVLQKNYAFRHSRVQARSNPGTGDRGGRCAAYIYSLQAKPVPT